MLDCVYASIPPTRCDLRHVLHGLAEVKVRAGFAPERRLLACRYRDKSYCVRTGEASDDLVIVSAGSRVQVAKLQWRYGQLESNGAPSVVEQFSECCATRNPVVILWEWLCCT